MIVIIIPAVKSANAFPLMAGDTAESISEPFHHFIPFGRRRRKEKERKKKEIRSLSHGTVSLVGAITQIY